jgi:hypothetical protein
MALSKASLLPRYPLICAGAPERACARARVQPQSGVLDHHRQAEQLPRAFGFSSLCVPGGLRGVRYSNAKIRFQSFFMLMITQPCFLAWSYSAWVKVPTLVAGSPWAGP